MAENFSNQATPKYLGYVYQVLIAIEQCFQAKPNEVIWIECRGDVYDGSNSTEVKHHFEPTNLTDNSIDFWKTLKNLVTEDVSEFNSLILHTTASIPKDSIFCDWNQLSKTQKYTKLKNNSPTETIKADYDKSITHFPRKDLLPILEKLSIKSSQLNVKEKWEELRNSRLLSQLNDEFKADALHSIYGYVNERAINNRYNWHIKINDFDRVRKHASAKWTEGKIPFEFIDKSEVDCGNQSFLFIDEMKKVNVRSKPIESAISDYLRAQINQIKLLELQPSIMPDILDAYDKSVLESQESLKQEYAEKIQEHDLETEKSLSTSRDLYHKSKNHQLINIPEVNNTQEYYHAGRMHHNVNEEYFVWRFCKKDLL